MYMYMYSHVNYMYKLFYSRMEYNLPVIMTVRMSAFLSDRMVGVVTAFSLFCSTMSPTKYSSLSTLSLCVCVCVCMCVGGGDKS